MAKKNSTGKTTAAKAFTTTSRGRMTLPALAAAMTFSCAAGALAADIPARIAAPPPAEPVYSLPVFTWTGFYVGVNAGWAGGANDSSRIIVSPPGTETKVGPGSRNAFVGGAQAGYNLQMGNLVLGVETDIQGIAGGRHRLGPAALPDGTTASGHNGAAWYGTLRPRIGYAFDRTLLYATGGLAYGENRFDVATVDPAGNAATLRGSGVNTGWTAGAGIEHAFTRNWSAKLEYSFVDLGRDRIDGTVFTPAGGATGTTISTRYHDSFHTLKAGINYRF